MFLKEKVTNIINIIKTKYKKVLHKVNGLGSAWKGAVYSLIIFYLITTIFISANANFGYGKLVDFIGIFAVAFIVFVLTYNLLKLIYKLILVVPKKLLFILLSVFFILSYCVYEQTGFSLEETLILVGLTSLIQLLLGVFVWLFVNRRHRVISGIIAVVMVGLDVFGVISLRASNNQYDHKVDYNQVVKYVGMEGIKNPGERGDYDVLHVNYGSGKDKRRKEFGENADIITYSVNGSYFLGKTEGFHGYRKKKYWGFDRYNLPLNGRVWYPDSEGEFPLVLIVHGNHSMEEWSDDGYEYLADNLASKGYMVVSVDENFLNGSWSGGTGNENDARAWMMLKHLELWRKWNDDKQSIFNNKVDMENISLIGHSRGGEAVGTAAAFNKLKFYPNDSDCTFNFNFNIKSVVAIAPTDGQYTPTGKLVPLENIDYMVMQGANDSDVDEFLGSRMYNRIKFNDDKYHIKAALYIEGANHGQFNASWGDEDISFPGNLFIDKSQLLKEEEQQKIALVYVGAFLDYTLKEREEYVPILKNYNNALKWLPNSRYMNRFEDSNFQIIADYEEDIDLTTTSLDGIKTVANRLYHWRENGVYLREGEETQNSAVFLQWRNSNLQGEEGSKSAYTLELPQEYNLMENSDLVFSIGDTGEDFEQIDDELYSDRTNLSILIEDIHGEKGEINLNDYGILWKAFKARFMKVKWLDDNYDSSVEPNFQTYVIPLSDFKANNTNVEVNSIKSISFVFDKVGYGEVMIDDIGFRKNRK